LQHD
jgi:hypothetical protein